MRLPVPRLLLLCLALLLASGHAAANQSRHMDADGSGACPEEAATGSARADEIDDPSNSQARRTTQKAKPAPTATPRTSDSPRTSTPRWHSFLPGMIR